MRSNLRTVITIYIVAFILVTVGAIIRMHSDVGEDILDSDDKIFFGIKNIWGYMHLALYTTLGYFGGLDLFPLAMLVSIVWELFEEAIAPHTDGKIKGGGAIDLFIDMTGYLLGSYLSPIR